MLRDKMLAVIADLNREVVEREELIEAIAIALLTRKTSLSWANRGRPKVLSSTAFAVGSPAPGSLSACSLNRPTRNSCSGVWTCPA